MSVTSTLSNNFVETILRVLKSSSLTTTTTVVRKALCYMERMKIALLLIFSIILSFVSAQVQFLGVETNKNKQPTQHVSLFFSQLFFPNCERNNHS